jgi:hypothetical protein
MPVTISEQDKRSAVQALVSNDPNVRSRAFAALSLPLKRTVPNESTEDL